MAILKAQERADLEAVLDLDNIDNLIFSIEGHWSLLCDEDEDEDEDEDDPVSDFAIAIFPPEFSGMLERSRNMRDQIRRDWITNPKFVSPAQPVAAALRLLIDSENLENRGDWPAMFKVGTIESAWRLAFQACRGPLSEAELNRLGWELTRLVALNIRPVLKALGDARSRGGLASGASRKEETASRDLAICEAGRRLLASGRQPRSLAGILSKTDTAKGLTGKQVRTILRAGDVLPPAPSSPQKGK